MNTGRGHGARFRQGAAGRSALRCLATVCATLGALLLWSAPALALSQRGHEFRFSFAGSTGEELSNPTGVALDESAHEVYVAEEANSLVLGFQCPTEAEEAKTVGEGKTPTCKFESQRKVSSPTAIAVDNSSGPSHGDIYVAQAEGEEKSSVAKFTPEAIATEGSAGKPFYRLKDSEPGEELGEIRGIAVDADGDLWVYAREEGAIFGFTSALKNKLLEPEIEETSEETICLSQPAFAVGPHHEAFYVGREHFNHNTGECEEEPRTEVVEKLGSTGEPVDRALVRQHTTAVAADESDGDVYVDNGASVAALDQNGAVIQRLPLPSEAGKEAAGAGIGVDASEGHLYVADSALNRIDVFGLEKAGKPTVDSVTAQNVSVGTVSVSAEIDPHGAETTYTFQYGTGDCATEPSSCTSTPAAAIAAGYGDQEVSAELTGLQPGTTYHFRVLAKNDFGEAAVLEESTSTLTTLPTSAGVLPDGRQWELVSPPNKGNAGIKSIPIEEGVVQASESGGAVAYVADAPLPGAEGNHAPNGSEILSTRGGTEWSSQNLETPYHDVTGILAGDFAEYRLFSPDLSLALVVPTATNAAPLADPPLTPPLSASEQNGRQESTLYIRRDAPLEPAALSNGASDQEAQTKREQQEIYAQAKSNGEVMKNPGYVALVNGGNVPEGTTIGDRPGLPNPTLEFQAVTPNLTHAVIESENGTALTTQPAGPEGNLYEWSDAEGRLGGQLKLVSLLPEEEGPAAKPALGAEGFDLRHAISDDGSRVIFTDDDHIYLRDTTTGETVQVDAPQGVTAPEGVESVFQSASADGSRIFFTSMKRLTPESTALSEGEIEEIDTPESGEEEGGEASHDDLYVFEVNPHSTKLSGTLTDLTVDPHFEENGEHANVQGIVTGVNEEGTIVYFVADGALAPNTSPGDCRFEWERTEEPAGATCNLYVERYNEKTEHWEAPKLIAPLSIEDHGAWGAADAEETTGEPRNNLDYVSARVSPNGHYLAFMSERSLTGYDNIDVNSHEPDEEVFLYNEETGRLTCASCNPSGAPPVGMFDSQADNGGAGPLVDGRGVWLDRWLAGSVPAWDPADSRHAIYQSRYLSDKGRLFFDSPDELVKLPAPDTGKNSGVENVYEYEQSGEGSCHTEPGCVALISSGTSKEESAFLDASTSGNDVFFITSAPLTPLDEDEAFDVYDAHVCEPSSPCLSQTRPSQSECESTEACAPGSSSSPSVPAAPASATSPGAGNVATQQVLPFTTSKPKPLTRAQKLADALKLCRKQKGHKKRAACEARARKLYGPKTHKQAKKGSRKGKR